MSTVSVSAYTITHSVTYVTDNILRTLKDIIREIGLSPVKLTNEWTSLETAMSTWLKSQDLEAVTLEVMKPGGSLATRWDLDISYGDSGDGNFYTDTAAIKYAIQKSGTQPSICTYRFLLYAKDGRKDVPGWVTCQALSTTGMSRYAVGTNIGSPHLAAAAYYWAK
jgi:hypothetical protein